MCLGLAVEVMSFDRTGKALAFARSDHVNTVTGLKDVNRNPLAFLNIAKIFYTEFSKMLQGRDRLGQLPALRVRLVGFKQTKMSTLRL
jgi:hypothetical protein